MRRSFDPIDLVIRVRVFVDPVGACNEQDVEDG